MSRSRRRPFLPVEPHRPDDEGAALLARIWQLQGEGREDERKAAEWQYVLWQTRHIESNPFMSASHASRAATAIDASAVAPAQLDEREAFLVCVFLRRYVTWCARRRCYAAMQGAARLWASIALTEVKIAGRPES